jgi:hypothetical protein
MPATVGLCERHEPPGEWPDPTPQAEGSAAPQAVTESTEFAPVAQLDRALPSGGRGQGFESLRARHLSHISHDPR